MKRRKQFFKFDFIVFHSIFLGATLFCCKLICLNRNYSHKHIEPKSLQNVSNNCKQVKKLS